MSPISKVNPDEGKFNGLRHGFYASTLELYVPVALATGELALPQDGLTSWTAHADLAEVDAIALTSPGALEGISAPLTAPEAFDFADVAVTLSELTGRAITRVVVDDEQWRESAVARGMPAAAAEFTLGMFRASREGEFSATDPALETLLGRRPTTMRTVVEEIVVAQR